MLTCTRCNTDKPEEEFYLRPKRFKHRNHRSHWCKQCYADHYVENKERQKASNRRAAIRRRYGLSLEEYDSLMAAGCSICGGHERMVMDHCHASGANRAPLCNGCNVMLGASGDNPALLRQGALYLEEHADLS